MRERTGEDEDGGESREGEDEGRYMWEDVKGERRERGG